MDEVRTHMDQTVSNQEKNDRILTSPELPGYLPQ